MIFIIYTSHHHFSRHFFCLDMWITHFLRFSLLLNIGTMFNTVVLHNLSQSLSYLGIYSGTFFCVWSIMKEPYLHYLFHPLFLQGIGNVIKHVLIRYRTQNLINRAILQPLVNDNAPNYVYEMMGSGFIKHSEPIRKKQWLFSALNTFEVHIPP